MSGSSATSSGSPSSVPEADQDLLDTITGAEDPAETLGIEPSTAERTLDAMRLDDVVRLGGVLGRGGMAVVREARQVAMDRSVAIKSGSQANERTDGLLLQEARLTGALEHPGILPVHDILVDGDGRPHIVMKRIDGLPWSELMHDAAAVDQRFGRTDLFAWNLEVLGAVCHALEFAHAMQVIHRDLKPANIMVADFGQVYVLDWGIAVSVDPGQVRFPRLADQDRLSGTPRYMAPEMLSRTGMRNLGPQTDVYLLGAILHEIATGRPPHHGPDLKGILEGIPRFVPSLPDGPAELEQILVRAMAPALADRYPDVRAFRRALEAFESHRGAVAIAERAQHSLDRLLPLLELPDASRIEVYDLFGQVRFGFLEAIRTWPEHDAARLGLDRVLQAMATWELDQGDDRAAEILLAQLDEVPSGLNSMLDAVREDRQQQRRALERLASRTDPAIGRRARIVAAVLMLVLWGTGPWLNTLAWWLDYATSASFLLIALGFVALARKQLLATRRNRVFSAVLTVGLVGNVLITLGPLTGALSHGSMQHGVWAMNGTMALMAAALLDVRFLLPAALYYACFLGSPALDPVRPLVSSALNSILAGTAAWAFWRR